MTKPVVPVEERFWAKVDKSGPVPEHRPDLGQCWLWTGSSGAGMPGYPTYGHMYLGKIHGVYKQAYAHRVSYWLAHGKWPVYDIDHLCRNTICVNPTHLEDVSTLENLKRAPLHMVNGDFPHLARSAKCKLVCKRDHYQTALIRNPQGRCRLCVNEYKRIRYALINS